MTIAVTGATGQLGRIIIEKLKNLVASDAIIALARSVEKADAIGVAARSCPSSKHLAQREWRYN